MPTDDHPTVDVLALCAPADVQDVERWVLWLRTIGITVQVMTTDQACEARTAAIVAFVKPASEHAVMKCPAVGEMLLERRPVVIVQLVKPEAPPPPHVFSIVPAYRIGEETAHANIQRVLDRHDIRGFRNDFIWHGANERRRETRLSRRWQWAVVISLIMAPLIAWQLLPVVRSMRHARAQVAALPSSGSAPASSSPATPVVPTSETPHPPKTRADFAMLHVRNLFEAWSRDNGFAPGQIDRVVTFFTDPTFIEGKGKQDRNGVRASLLVLEQQWPNFHEHAQTMTTETLPDGAIAVTVVSQHQSRNDQRGTSDAGAWRSRYTIVFDAQEKPLISRIDFPSEKL